MNHEDKQKQTQKITDVDKNMGKSEHLYHVGRTVKRYSQYREYGAAQHTLSIVTT